MAKRISFGVDGVARTANTPYFGVNDVARTVKKGYFGVDGVARIFLGDTNNYKQSHDIIADIMTSETEYNMYVSNTQTIYWSEDYIFDASTGIYTLTNPNIWNVNYICEASYEDNGICIMMNSVSGPAMYMYPIWQRYTGTERTGKVYKVRLLTYTSSLNRLRFYISANNYSGAVGRYYAEQT